MGYLGASIINFILGISPLNAILGLPFSETVRLGQTISIGDALDLRVPLIAFALIGGLVFNTGGAILFRVSNLTTDNLGVNALGYTIPVFSLIWLAIFAKIRVASVPYLLIGAAAIISTNLLINFEAERLAGFKALVISLWACGTWAYVRDDFYSGWGWLGKSDAYFDVLFLSATVFALILSFRTARLSSRIQEEDNRALKLFRELEELEERDVIRSRMGISGNILTIDEKTGDKMERAYAEARRGISDALAQDDCPDREKLLAVSVGLDRLAHSRQQGIQFGELCALIIFAGLIVGTALLSRPAEVSSLTGFLVEMFAMTFPAVIIFLTFNVFDLQRGRVSRILKRNPQYGEDGENGKYGVAFQDTEGEGNAAKHTGRRTVEQWISVIVGLVLIALYACLFLAKWELVEWGKMLAKGTGWLP